MKSPKAIAENSEKLWELKKKTIEHAQKVTGEPREEGTLDPGGFGSTSLGPISHHPRRLQGTRCKWNKTITQLG